MFSFRDSRRQRAVKVRQRRDPATGTPPVGSARGMRRAAGRLLVAGTSVRDLLFRAKHLFGGAIRHPGAPLTTGLARLAATASVDS
jgi:hypothetical protein